MKSRITGLGDVRDPVAGSLLRHHAYENAAQAGEGRKVARALAPRPQPNRLGVSGAIGPKTVLMYIPFPEKIKGSVGHNFQGTWHTYP